jgi:hypothetical protein
MRIMAVTQTDIDNLDAAIAAGTRSVTLDGQTVTYNTTASLILARNDLQNRLVAQNRQVRRPKQVYMYQSGRGYD